MKEMVWWRDVRGWKCLEWCCLCFFQPRRTLSCFTKKHKENISWCTYVKILCELCGSIILFGKDTKAIVMLLVFRRCYSELLLKAAGEIGGGIKTYFVGNFIDT